MTSRERLLKTMNHQAPDRVPVDLGMQSGPQISPEMYVEFFKPRHKALWTRAKELANVPPENVVAMFDAVAEFNAVGS